MSLDASSGTVVSGSDDETVRIWDLATGDCRKVLDRESPEGLAYLSTSSDDGIHIEKDSYGKKTARIVVGANVWSSPPFVFSARSAQVSGAILSEPQFAKLLTQHGAQGQPTVIQQ